MLYFLFKSDENGEPYIETNISGKALLTISQLNKGTRFSREERRIFNLRGKLPNRVESLDDQLVRTYLQYKSFDI